MGLAARRAYAELLAARGEDRACRTAAAAALRDTEDDGGYLILVPACASWRTTDREHMHQVHATAARP